MVESEGFEDDDAIVVEVVVVEVVVELAVSVIALVAVVVVVDVVVAVDQCYFQQHSRGELTISA